MSECGELIVVNVRVFGDGSVHYLLGGRANFRVLLDVCDEAGNREKNVSEPCAFVADAFEPVRLPRGRAVTVYLRVCHVRTAVIARRYASLPAARHKRNLYGNSPTRFPQKFTVCSEPPPGRFVEHAAGAP